MKIIVIGGGGREHAIIKKLRESPLAGKIYALPGNAGMEEAGVLSVAAVRGRHAMANFPEDYQRKIKEAGDLENFEKENFVLAVEAVLEGLETKNQRTWHRSRLEVGDEITLKIVETDTVDEAKISTKISHNAVF